MIKPKIGSYRFSISSNTVQAAISIIFSLFFLCVFLKLGGPAQIAYCAGASSSEIGTAVLNGTAAFPQFMQLPDEDCRSILFGIWKDLEQLMETCRQGKLPHASDCYELVSQLRPIQLEILIDSIELKPPLISEAAIQEWARISVELKSSTCRLFKLFEETLLPGLIVITGKSISLDMPLEQSLELLLSGSSLSHETELEYTRKILDQTEPLIDVYRALFELLPSNPEITFLEKTIPHVNPGRNLPISQSEVEAIQAIIRAAAKFRQAMYVAMRFNKLRRQIRKGIKRKRDV